MAHQHNIHHGYLVKNHHIRFQGLILIAPKAGTITVTAGGFQQPVHRPGAPACCFTKALCRPAGRCSQQNLQAQLFQNIQHGANHGGLAGAGTAGQHENTMFQHRFHRLPLLLRQDNPRFLFPAMHQLARVAGSNRHRLLLQIQKALRRLSFRPIEILRINQDGAPHRLLVQPACCQFLLQHLPDHIPWYHDALLHIIHQLLFRHAAMTVDGNPLQLIGKSR